MSTKQVRGVVRGGVLSDAQLKIDALLRAGVSQKEIAEQMGIGRDSVNRHVDKIRDYNAFQTMQRGRGR